MLTAKQVRRYFWYDPDIGVLLWREKTRSVSTGIVVGEAAGWVTAKGYIQVEVLGKCYQAHVLVWLYMTGRYPKHQVDHRDRCKDNNCWDNLRPATNKQNQENTGLRRDNTSGHKGVWWRKEVGKWKAMIRHNGYLHSLGYFSDKSDAIAARKAAEQRYFTHL